MYLEQTCSQVSEVQVKSLRSKSKSSLKSLSSDLGKMAAGALGVVTALLVYSLLFNFLSPINFSFFADHFNNHSLFNKYEKTFVNNADWLVKQTYNALGNFGHGKHTLAVTFI